MTSADLSHLIPSLERLSGARVLCIGDVMLDHYVYGHVERVSPEAPIPVVRVDREQATLGGAGNVLRNLRALGAQASFVSVVGDDQAGRDINRLVGEEGEVEAYLLMERGRPSTLKTRYVGGYQQMLRVDRESVAPLTEHLREDLVRLATDTLADQSVVVLSDYAKGVLTDGVAAKLIEACRRAGVWVVVDPKGLDYKRYSGANLLTPNRRELAEATKMPVGNDDEIVAAARYLIESCKVDAVLVTRSHDGMTLVDPSIEPLHIPAAAREVFDVSGAGDTVLATIAAGLGSGLSLVDAARLSNVAAGVVVGKIGTAVTHAGELAEVLNGGSDARKHLPLDQALDRIARWRRGHLRVGFTNGCFDLLHPGHISLLRQARASCDRLVVALNSDSSVRRLKGPSRPVQNEASRVAVMAGLADVDLVVTFEDDTPLALIDAIRPEVLVKGADYTEDQVVGASLVRAYGGRIMLAQLSPGQSTTATIGRMADPARRSAG